MTCQSVDLFSFILLVDGSEYILCLISSGNWSAFVSSDAAFPCSLSSLLELQLGEVPLQRSSTWAEFAPPGNIWHCPETFSVVTLGWAGSAAGILWVEAVGFAGHPAEHRAAPARGVLQPKMPTVPRLGNPGLELLILSS